MFSIQQQSKAKLSSWSEDFSDQLSVISDQLLKARLLRIGLSKIRHWSLITVYCSLIHCSLLTAQSLSPQTKVSLLTMAPGDELYSSFGHSAIWVYDPAIGLDRVYNYGTFDFRTGNFYWKFIRGTLPYQLSAYPFQYAIAEAQGSNRSLTEQVLNLNPAQKQKLYDFLETNYQPENRQYFYKFYYDNCATRPRDVIKTGVGPGFQWLPMPDLTGKSYRRWMNDYLVDKPLARLGMNLAIGQPADQPADLEGSMYLPDNLMKGLAKARNGNQLLVSATNELFVAQPVESGLTTWWIQILGGILFLPTAIWLYKKHNDGPFWFDKTLLILAGSVGLLLLFLWFGTDHGVPDWNRSLFIYLPTHLIVAFLLRKPVHFRWLSLYFLLCLGFLVFGIATTALESRTFFVEFLLLVRSNQLMRFYRGNPQPTPVHES
ncbi:MAG: DUF4105 domain-containing protein [Cytophagaceae bacterium]|nr:DUF4105 domain-containing protein [Cytophagaceae bacterium]